MPDGEYICLWWADWPEAEYVRGHVTPEEFFASLEREGVDREAVQEPVHAFARWAQTGFARENGLDATLQDYNAPGRGRFKVTRAQTRRRTVLPPLNGVVDTE